LSPAELAAIGARTAAATPGLWGYHAPSGDILAPDLSMVAGCLHVPDGLWIAHARADLPALLAEVARLELEAAGLRQALELLTACACEVDGGLDCPACESVPPLVRQALDGTAGRALTTQLRAARELVERARAHQRGDQIPCAGCADALAAYDQAAGTDTTTAAEVGPAIKAGEER
jgi:hypothetical protein